MCPLLKDLKFDPDSVKDEDLRKVYAYNFIQILSGMLIIKPVEDVATVKKIIDIIKKLTNDYQSLVITFDKAELLSSMIVLYLQFQNVRTEYVKEKHLIDLN